MNNPLKRDFLILKVIFLLLLSGQFLFLAAAIFFVTPDVNLAWADFFKNPMLLLAPALFLLTVALAGVVHYFQNKKKPRLHSLPSKMHHYRDTLILKAALFEISGLYSVALIALTHSLKPFLFFAISVMAFLSLWPTVGRLKSGYGLE